MLRRFMMDQDFLGTTTGSLKRLWGSLQATDSDPNFYADTDNFTDADADADNGGRRILGPPLHQVDTQPLRCPLGPEEKRKVSRWLSVSRVRVQGRCEQWSGIREHSEWWPVRSEHLRDWPTGYRHTLRRYTLEYLNESASCANFFIEQSQKLKWEVFFNRTNCN